VLVISIFSCLKWALFGVKSGLEMLAFIEVLKNLWFALNSVDFRPSKKITIAWDISSCVF
jgi:hypothetical protein